MSGYEPEQSPLDEREAWVPPRPPSTDRQKGSPPCLLYGAVGCGVVLVLFIILGVVAYFGIRGWLAGMIEKYTDTAPITLPIVEGSEEALHEVQARVDAFKTAVEKNEPTEPLELSEWDLNVLIQFNPMFKELKDQVYISIVDDHLKGEVCIPLDKFGFELAKGRYFNGSAVFDVSLRDGTPYVYVTEATVKGVPIPDEIMAEIRTENLAEESQQDPETQELLQHLQSVEVSDGKLIVVPKGNVVEAPEGNLDEVPLEAEATDQV